MHRFTIDRTGSSIARRASGAPLVAVAGLVASLAAQGALSYEVPQGWSAEPASSSMRVAQFTLPQADGDPEDGEVVIYYFQGAGGSAQANLDRWIAQMRQPSGQSASGVARTWIATVHGLRVTQADVAGTYVGEMMPGQSIDRYNEPNYRLLGAVVETAGGPYFIKAVGPLDTIARWEASFETFVASLRFE